MGCWLGGKGGGSKQAFSSSHHVCTYPGKALDIKVHPLAGLEGEGRAWGVAFAAEKVEGELEDRRGDGLEGVDVGEVEVWVGRPGGGGWGRGGGGRRHAAATVSVVDQGQGPAHVLLLLLLEEEGVVFLLMCVWDGCVCLGFGKERKEGK